jgi:hypothetical protein
MNLNSSYLLINPNEPNYNKVFNDSFFYINNEDIISKKNKKNKNVRFNPNINFKIIPNRDFLRYHNLLNELWWKKDDYNNFKSQSMMEIISTSLKYPLINKKQIAKILYQPTNSNF